MILVSRFRGCFPRGAVFNVRFTRIPSCHPGIFFPKPRVKPTGRPMSSAFVPAGSGRSPRLFSGGDEAEVVWSAYAAWLQNAATNG